MVEFATSKLFRSLWLKCNENSKQLPLAKVTCINSRLELKFAQFKSILPLIIITPMHTCIAPEDINGQSPPNSPSYRHHHKPICYFILHDKSSKRLGGGVMKTSTNDPFFLDTQICNQQRARLDDQPYSLGKENYCVGQKFS